jgi:glutathione S-transferase
LSFLLSFQHQGLHLITESTPNGKKVQILLEDLREAYGLQFTTSLIDIDTDEQKQEWFLRLNHNGRIPIIIDNNISPPHPVMESTAELLYLVNRYDKDRLFSFADDMKQSELIQWIIFCQASGQPHQGQTIDFFRGAGKDNSCKLARHARFFDDALQAWNELC